MFKHFKSEKPTKMETEPNKNEDDYDIDVEWLKKHADKIVIGILLLLLLVAIYAVYEHINYIHLLRDNPCKVCADFGTALILNIT